ncbi:hypothetical protein [Amycolatopsis plumensis]|uniref:hypothetical protein n=1 Tax=Amycolatopsis plumensis TaxID=236508 RepID=UPI00361325FA
MTTISADIDRTGTGPAVIPAGGGGAVDSSENAPLAAELSTASPFTATTAAVEARAATPRRTRSSASSRTLPR